MLGQPGRAVGHHRGGVVDAGVGEVFARPGDEVLVDVEGPHLPAGGDDLAEEGGVVAGGGSGFQDLVAGLGAELFELGGDDGRRGDAGDHLAVVVVLDRDRVLLVRALQVDVGQEGVAVGGAEGVDGRLAVQVAAVDEPLGEGFAVLVGVGCGCHGCLHSREARFRRSGLAGRHVAFSGGEGDVTAEPRGGGLRFGRYARAIEGEDRVVGEDAPDSAYQPAVVGEQAQAAAGVLERGDALGPARFRVGRGGVRVHQPPHRGEGCVQGGPVRRGDGWPQGSPSGVDVASFERVQPGSADHGGQQHHGALAGSGGTRLGERGRAVGAEHVVGDRHAFRTAEGMSLRLVDPARPAGEHAVSDELVQEAGDGLFGAQAHACVLA
ncbi:hypothetical protein SMICM304S_10507 [Streptomyces microflavus]